MHLRLLASEPLSQAFDPAPFNIARTSTRPALAYVEIPLDLDQAPAVPVPSGLDPSAALALLVEAARTLSLLTASRRDLNVHLDLLAADPAAPTPGGDTRLYEYGRQLRAAAQRPPGQGSSPPVLLVPYRLLTAWRRAAIAAGQGLDHWASERLSETSAGQLLWEAAAAERGETLAEWILAQAARR